MRGLRGIGAFFDAFNRGYDTVGRVMQDRDLRAVADAAPEDITQPDQSGAGPTPDGRSLEEVQGSRPPVRVGTRFLGRNYDTPLDEAGIANARMRAMADVVGRTDPLTGMRLRQQVVQGERDDARFQREGARFDQEQAEGGLRLKGLRRQDRRDQRTDDYDAAYAKHVDAWNKMGDAEKEALITKLSYDTNVKGFGAWVPGKGKTAGYMSYQPPGADPVRLSNKEAAEAYALTNLMAVDPARARAEMDKVSANVRAFAQHAFAAQAQGVGVNNQAAHMAATDQYHLNSLGVQREGLRLRNADSWLPVGTTKDGKEIVSFDRRTNKFVSQPLPEGVDVSGLFPKTTGTKPSGRRSLSDQERLTAHSQAVKEIANLPPNATAGDTAKVYAKYGLDPEDYGVSDPVKQLVDRLGAASSEPNVPTLTPARGNLTPFTKSDLERQDVSGYQRRMARGLFGGLTGKYEYYDPRTGKTLSVEDYQRLSN